MQFSFPIVCEKTRFNDKFFSSSGSLFQFEQNMSFEFFRKKHPPCNKNLQWRIIWPILGIRKTACEAAELCGVTELIGQMSWHLKQVGKHFYWRGVLKNALSRGVLKRNCELTWKQLWPRVYSVFSETLPYRPWFYTKKGDTLIYMTRLLWLWQSLLLWT